MDRFWSKVDQSGGPDACWLWTPAGNAGGYGVFKIDGRQVYVHRLAYELMVGALDAGQVVHHQCRNRRCVNPAHLEAVASHAEHRVLHRTYACPKGHSRAGRHLYVGDDGKRRCRTCDTIRRRESRGKVG